MRSDHDNKYAERMIDAVLAERSSAEPRAGLELRVLATLGAERECRAARSAWWSWRWAFAGTALVAVIALAISISISRHASPQRTIASDQAAGAAPFPEGEGAPAQVTRAVSPISSSQASARTVPHHRAVMSRARVGRGTGRKHSVREQQSEPRLPKFPSPSPLSEQERLLLAYVNQTPQEEILRVAQEQQAREQEREAEAEATGTTPGDR